MMMIIIIMIIKQTSARSNGIKVLLGAPALLGLLYLLNKFDRFSFFFPPARPVSPGTESESGFCHLQTCDVVPLQLASFTSITFQPSSSKVSFSPLFF